MLRQAKQTLGSQSLRAPGTEEAAAGGGLQHRPSPESLWRLDTGPPHAREVGVPTSFYK